jgi:peptide/nickel transport system permease protein
VADLRRLTVRILGGLAVVVGVAAFTWVLLYAMRPSLFPDEPSAPEQLGRFLERAFLHFDFDRARSGSAREVNELVREGLPADIVLFAGGLATGLALGVAAGLFCGLRRRSLATRAIETLATIAISAPVYVVGLTLLLLLGTDIGDVDIGLSIPVEYVPFGEGPLRWLGSIVVPWLVLGLPLAGLCVRTMSSSTAEVLAEDHIRAAQARGLSRRRLIGRHVLPVAVVPTLALASASANILLLNMVLVERVFGVPGFLQEVTGALRAADVPVLLALSVFFAAFIVVASIVLESVVDRLQSAR